MGWSGRPEDDGASTASGCPLSVGDVFPSSVFWGTVGNDGSRV